MARCYRMSCHRKEHSLSLHNRPVQEMDDNNVRHTTKRCTAKASATAMSPLGAQLRPPLPPLSCPDDGQRHHASLHHKAHGCSFCRLLCPVQEMDSSTICCNLLLGLDGPDRAGPLGIIVHAVHGTVTPTNGSFCHKTATGLSPACSRARMRERIRLVVVFAVTYRLWVHCDMDDVPHSHRVAPQDKNWHNTQPLEAKCSCTGSPGESSRGS